MEANGFVTYQIYFRLTADAEITVGRIGVRRFPAGRYVYTGSARHHFEARVRRHLSGAKRLRWHIDYLLATPCATVTGVARSTLEECLLNQATRGILPMAGFGASDCRRGCGSHLKYLGA